jgi:hypothetical protein
MESRDGRKQLQTIWNLNISHEDRTEAFNGGATRGFAPQITKTRKFSLLRVSDASKSKPYWCDIWLG